MLGSTSFDEVLLIQMSGTNAGAYEYAEIESINGAQVTLTGPLSNSFHVDGGNSRVQLLRVPNYRTVVVDGVLTAHNWNGYTGGIVAFRAEEVVINSGGEIDVMGIGYAGGPGGNESPASRPDTGSTGASYISPVPLNGPVAPADTTSAPGPANGGAGTGGQGSRAQDAAAGGAGR